MYHSDDSMLACVYVGVCNCMRGVCAYMRVHVFACMRVHACVYVRER